MTKILLNERTGMTFNLPQEECNRVVKDNNGIGYKVITEEEKEALDAEKAKKAQEAKVEPKEPVDPVGDAILGKNKRSAEDLEKLKETAAKVGHSYHHMIGFDKLNDQLLDILLPLARQLEIEDLENLDAIQVFEKIEAKKAQEPA